MGHTVLYARRSKPSQSDVRDTVDSQLDELRRYAGDHGWSNTLELSERGTPASAAADRAARRQVFHGELMPMVERGEVDRVLVVEPSRISRHMATFIPFVDQVETHFTRQNTDSRTSDPLRLALDAGLAAQESKIRSDRQQAHRQRMREAGRKRSGGFRSYGYEPDGVTLRPAEVKLIRRSAQDVLEGKSLRQVTIAWREAGVLNARGRPPAPTSVRRTLVFSDLLDEETREKMRAVFSDPRRRGNVGGFNKRSYLLGGMCFCDLCGNRLISYPGYRGREYRCRVSVTDGTPDACGRAKTMAEPLEEQVRWFVAFTTQWQEPSEETEDAATIAAERSQLAKRRDEVADAFVDGALTKQQAKRANDRISASERDLDERSRGLELSPFEDAEPYDVEDFGAWRRLIERRVERAVVREDGTSFGIERRTGEKVELTGFEKFATKKRTRKQSPLS
jgi:site-specific DNA recombinase